MACWVDLVKLSHSSQCFSSEPAHAKLSIQLSKIIKHACIFHKYIWHGMFLVYMLQIATKINVHILFFFCVLQYWLSPLNVCLLLKAISKKQYKSESQCQKRSRTKFEFVYNKHSQCYTILTFWPVRITW